MRDVMRRAQDVSVGSRFEIRSAVGAAQEFFMHDARGAYQQNQ